MFDRMRVIKAHLEAVSRGRSPTGEQIGIWYREIEAIPDEDLDPTFRAARSYHTEMCDRGKRWGKITPDDVLAIWRTTQKKTIEREDAPENPDCPLGCEAGLVSLIGADGYDFVTRCDCSSGDWWAVASPRWERMTSAGAYLENPAYKLARPKADPMPPEHIDWLNKRAADVGHPAAMREYMRHMAERAGG